MKAQKKQRYEVLDMAMANSAMVSLRCRAKGGWKYNGYVVGLSENFVLLQNALEHVFLNGYSVFPLRELISVKTLPDDFLHRVLQMDNQFPSAPSGIVMDDWQSLVASADAHFPLVTLHLEHEYPDSCYIGRVSEIKKRAVTLREISPKAKWIKEREPYRFKDITQVDFGGRYEAALWRVAQSELSGSENV
ncbi:MAG: hypothetical protein H8F28_20060 [Fibrella sp.]|nr:hypothetical protein [Armatimonadota bacterium]